MTSSTPPEFPQKRTNRLLRMLVDEMLEHVRELQRHAGPWPAEERAYAEAQLERIMAKVREAAVASDPAKGSS